MAASTTHADTGHGAVRRVLLWTAIFLGIGLMGAVDEIIFHQLLQWHNFYVHTTDYWRVFSDGLFHIATATLLFVGAWRLWQHRQPISRLVQDRLFWGGVFLGAGGFQLFDGTVNHKLLMLHPVREGVENLLPYDLAWNGAAIVLLALGWLLLRGTSQQLAQADETGDRGARTRR
jgi:uncharacterized membrane protein